METNNKRQPSSEHDDLALSLSLGCSPVRPRQNTARFQTLLQTLLWSNSSSELPCEMPITNPLVMPSTGNIQTNTQDRAHECLNSPLTMPSAIETNPQDQAPEYLNCPVMMPSASNIETNPQDHAHGEDVNSPSVMPSTSDIEINPQDLAHEDVNNNNNTVAASRSGRSRSRSSKGKSETVPPPFPWATDRRATIYSYNHLRRQGVKFITGEVQCKRCEKRYEMEFNIKEKLQELMKFIKSNKNTMHNRAPRVWVEPVLPTCKHCGQENSAKPLLTNTKKREINWLFLLLGQMLGCCNIYQLKYFCKHTNDHRTGAKDRVLYSTYIGLFIQFVPEARIWFR